MIFATPANQGKITELTGINAMNHSIPDAQEARPGV
jgi:hypothetical protein